MICVFDKDNLNFEGNGNAVLLPTEAKVRSVAGGNYDLTMVHPMEPEGKWRHLVPGAVVRVPIPEEEIENAFAGYAADVYKTTEEAALRESPSEPTAINYQQWNWQQAYEVGDKVSVPGWSHRNYECTYYDGGSQTIMVPPYNSSWWKAINDTTGGAAVLVTLPAGTELYFIEDVDATWYKMSTYYGIEGYIKKSQVEFWKHLTPEETKPRIIREQLFRITNATADTKSHVVNVTAQHVSYDLNGIIVQDVSIRQASPAMAIGRMVEGFMIPYDGTIATNLTSDDNGTYTDDIKGKTGMYCFLDPDKGIVGKFDAALKRDNWDLFILQKTNTNRGFSIRYRKNLLGVSWARKSDGLITRVVPVAKDEKGEALYLPEKWIDSDYINDYPVIRMERLSMKEQVGKDKGTGDGSTWTLSDLYDEMRAKAAERFTVDKVDRIVDEVTVDFEQLGDTDEHAALKGFEKVLLYDAVTVIHEEIGLNMVMTVNELEWDAIRQKITSVKVSNVGNRAGRSVTGYNVQNKSIGWQKLTDDVGDDILSQVRDIIPEYADPDAPRPAIPVMNTKTQDGYVLKGGSNANKVWGTDASGNPGWTTPAAYTLPLAADGTRGGIQIGYSESGKKYAVKLDSEKAYVEVPWTADGGNAATVNGKTVAANVPADAKFTDHEYTAGTGLSLSNGQFAVRLAYTTSGKNYKVQADNSGNLYVNVPWENTVYSLPLAANGTRGGIQIGYSESGKKYAVKLDSEKAYVEVPWTADGGNAATVNGKTVAANVPADAKFTDHEYTNGTGLSLSNGQFAVRLAYTTSGKNYKVQADNSGNLYVNVPWENTVYSLPLAANGTRGGVQIGYTQSGQNYPVQLSGEKMYVNVPWTDTNTWRPVQNNLTSTSTTDSLSAYQGKVLNDGKVAKVGDTMTGNLGIEKDSEAYVYAKNTAKGTQVWLDAMNSGEHGIYSSGYWNGSAYTTNGKWIVYRNTAGNILLNGDAATVSGGYTVKKNVPADAVFTDTNTWRPVQDNLTSTSSTDCLSAKQGKALKDLIETLLLNGSSPTSVASNDDFNNFTKRGCYVIAGNSIMTTLSNRPSNTSGRCYVINVLGTGDNITGAAWLYGMQVFVQYDNAIYIRFSTTGSGTTATFNSWIRYTTTTDLATKVAKSGDTTTGNFTNTGDITNTGYFTNNGSVLVYPGSNMPAGTGGKITAFNTDRGFNIALQASSGGGSLSSTGYWNGSAYVESSLTILDRSTDGKAYFHGNADTATYAESAGNADTLDNLHEHSFFRSRDISTTSGGETLWSQIGSRQFNGALPESLTGMYTWGEVISLPTGNVRFDLYVSDHSSDASNSGKGIAYRSGWNTTKRPWAIILDSFNYTNYVVPNTGGNFTGSVGLNKAGDTYLYVENTTTGNKVGIDTGDSTNHGLYSNGYNNGSSYVSSWKWMIYRNSAGNVIVNGDCTGSAGSVAWSGVTSRPLQYFGGSGTNSVTITFPGAGHAIIAIASGIGTIFISGAGSIYSTLPSGFTATCASGTYKVTISRSNSTTFYFHGLYLAGTTELPVS